MEKNAVYFQDGELKAESGQVRAYELNNEFYLDHGDDHKLIDKDEYVVDYIWQIRDKPFGKCLILGMGLGRVAEYILSVPKVTSVVVVEPNSDVLNVQRELETVEDSDSHDITIINDDILSYLYLTEDRFDFVFLKCYSEVNEDTLPLIADVVKASKRVTTHDGNIVGWLNDNTEEIFISTFFDLFN